MSSQRSRFRRRRDFFENMSSSDDEEFGVSDENRFNIICFYFICNLLNDIDILSSFLVLKIMQKFHKNRIYSISYYWLSYWLILLTLYLL